MPGITLSFFVTGLVMYQAFSQGILQQAVFLEKEWAQVQAESNQVEDLESERLFLIRANQHAAGWRKEIVPSFKLLSQLRNILTETEIPPEAFRLDMINTWKEIEAPSPCDRDPYPPIYETTQALLQVHVKRPERSEAQRIQRTLLKNPILGPLLERVELQSITPIDLRDDVDSATFVVQFLLIFHEVPLLP